MDPKWLLWAREMQAIAQSGLAFTRDPYDAERYTALSALAAQIVAAQAGLDAGPVEALFAAQAGYATPKVDVRGAVFDSQDRLLLVREAVDGGRWTLPGGWADVNQTPAECVLREIREESGYEASIVKLAAVWDRQRQGHPPSAFDIYKLFFICRLEGGAAATSLETTDAAFFAEADLPADLSLGRVLPQQLRRMFVHHQQPELPAEFD